MASIRLHCHNNNSNIVHSLVRNTKPRKTMYAPVRSLSDGCAESKLFQRRENLQLENLLLVFT